MGIIRAEIVDRESVRNRLVDELAELKRSNPGFRVLDVGGRHNPWADAVVDAYADIFEFDTDKKLYVGDINDAGIWQEMAADGPFDFVICSHVLEDIRDPITGLRWLPQVAKAGFLGLPNKHTEFSNQVSNYWLGQSHHNWIFSVRRENGHSHLLALPKWACIEYFNHARTLPSSRQPAATDRAAGGSDAAPASLEGGSVAQDHAGSGQARPADSSGAASALEGGAAAGDDGRDLGTRILSWFDPALVGRDNELAVHWEGDLPFESPEYTLSVEEQLHMYRNLLAEGL